MGKRIDWNEVLKNSLKYMEFEEEGMTISSILKRCDVTRSSNNIQKFRNILYLIEGILVEKYNVKRNILYKLYKNPRKIKVKRTKNKKQYNEQFYTYASINEIQHGDIIVKNR